MCQTAAVGGLLVLSGCNSQNIFLANFNSEAVGSLPATNQPTGTVAVDQGAGTVRVSVPPPGGSTNWVEISHPTAPSPQTALQGKFSQTKGDGTYGLLAALFIPSKCGVVTLQFEPVQNGPTDYLSFLHLDFMDNNTVRIDDGKASFGTFPRDQFFTVSVNLKVTPTGSTASMSLFGTGASGNLDYAVQPQFASLARQIGGIRLWMGFQFTGAFKADDITVSYTAP
jgi:hypothetical protein